MTQPKGKWTEYKSLSLSTKGDVVQSALKGTEKGSPITLQKDVTHLNQKSKDASSSAYMAFNIGRFKEGGIVPKCPKCLKPMKNAYDNIQKKINPYLWQTTCGHNKDLRLSIG